KAGLRLGLDLQGGIHMVIAPDLAVATEHELTHLRSTLEARLADQKIATKERRVEDARIELQLADAALAEKARDLLASDFDVLRREEPEPGRFVLTLTALWERP